MVGLEWFETALFLTTFVGHTIVMFELIHGVWLPGLLPTDKLFLTKLILDILWIPVTPSLLIIIAMFLLLVLGRCLSLERWVYWNKWPWWRIFTCYFYIIMYMPFFTGVTRSERSFLGNRESTFMWISLLWTLGLEV